MVSSKENMKNRPKVGIGVLITNTQHQVLLGKRIYNHGMNTWSPPGGHLEYGEDFATCAIREVYEETDLKIKDPQFVAVTNDIHENEQKHYISIFMQAISPVGQVVINKEPEKVEQWQWFSMDNLPENLFLPLSQLLQGKAFGGVFTDSEIEISKQRAA